MCVGCAGDESVWASERVGKDTPAGRRARDKGGWSGTCRRGRQRLVGWEFLGWVRSDIGGVRMARGTGLHKFAKSA